MAYPAVGVLLALVLAGGLLAVRLAWIGDLSFDGVRTDLSQSLLTYAYVVVSTAALLVALGLSLGAKEDSLWASSHIDPLTHVANRRHFDATLGDEVARASESGMPLALLVVDLDHLKRINDEAGHAAGDAALRALAETIRTSARSRDLTARFGGDEFVIVMPRTRAAEAWALAERIRASLAASWSAAPGRKGAAPTVSIGIADLDLAEERTADALFASADRALYAAKRGGRDRTVIASQMDDTVVAYVPRAISSDPRDPARTLVGRVVAPHDAPCRCAATAQRCEVLTSGIVRVSESGRERPESVWPAAG